MNIYIDGTFDLLHSGHYNFLEQAKKYGKKLIVGVISDKNVKSYKRYPILELKDRCKFKHSYFHYNNSPTNHTNVSL